MEKYPFSYQDVKKLSPTQLFNILDDWLNANSMLGRKYGEFSKALNSTHRTLQQLVIGMFVSVILQYGRDHQEDYSFDARNEDAVMFSRKLVAQVDSGEIEAHMRFI